MQACWRDLVCVMAVLAVFSSPAGSPYILVEWDKTHHTAVVQEAAAAWQVCCAGAGRRAGVLVHAEGLGDSVFEESQGLRQGCNAEWQRCSALLCLWAEWQLPLVQAWATSGIRCFCTVCISENG